MQAIAVYEEAIRLGLTDYPRVRLRLAECHRLNKNAAQAAAMYTRFLEDFGLERLKRTDRAEIDARLEAYRQMLSI